MVKRRALGKGLEALIPKVEYREDELILIDVDRIEPNPYQPRTKFPEEGIRELASSIEERGLLQPIIVRRIDDRFQLVVGERRLKAVKFLGWKRINCVIKNVEERDLLQIALIENIQRDDINPMEIARAFKRLSDEFGLTQEEIARAVGKDRATIANTMRLLKLPVSVQEMVEEGKISISQAKELLSFEDVDLLIKVAREVVQKGLTVEEIVRKRRGRKIVLGKVGGGGVEPEVEAIYDEIRRRLKTKVILRYKKGRGRLIIEFYSDEELDRIIKIIRGY
ncbi:MAG: ParB/RepB/Spo0J family partition protein [bacterium]